MLCSLAADLATTQALTCVLCCSCQTTGGLQVLSNQQLKLLTRVCCRSNLMTRFLLSLFRPGSDSSRRLTKTTTVLQQEADRNIGLLDPLASV